MNAKTAAVITTTAIAAVQSYRLRKERRAHKTDINTLYEMSVTLLKQTEFLCTKLDENGIEITEFDRIVYNAL